MKSDQQIHSDITAELSWDPGLCAKRIHISVHQGLVTLTGQVPNQWHKVAASRAAQRVYGVYGIAEKLQVEGSTLN